MREKRMSQNLLAKELEEQKTDPPKFFETKGIGVVTLINRKKGDFLMSNMGETISTTEGDKREDRNRTESRFSCKAFCIDTSKGDEYFGRLVNQGGKQKINCKMKEVDDGLVLFALRHIDEGEELLYDYGLKNLPWLKTANKDQSVKDVLLNSETDSSVDAKSIAQSGEGKEHTIVTSLRGQNSESLIKNDDGESHDVLYTQFKEGASTIEIALEDHPIAQSSVTAKAGSGCDASMGKTCRPGLESGVTFAKQTFTADMKDADLEMPSHPPEDKIKEGNFDGSQQAILTAQNIPSKFISSPSSLSAVSSLTDSDQPSPTDEKEPPSSSGGTSCLIFSLSPVQGKAQSIAIV